jgi:hypothetical protein
MPNLTATLQFIAAYLLVSICFWQGWAADSEIDTTLFRIAAVLFAVSIALTLLEKTWAMLLKHYWISRVTYGAMKKEVQ